MDAWDDVVITIFIFCIVGATLLVHDLFFSAVTFNTLASFVGSLSSLFAFVLALKIYRMWKLDATHRELHSRALKLYGSLVDSKHNYRDFHSYITLYQSNDYDDFLVGYDRVKRLSQELSSFIYMAKDLLNISDTEQLEKLNKSLQEQMKPMSVKDGDVFILDIHFSNDPRLVWEQLLSYNDISPSLRPNLQSLPIMKSIKGKTLDTALFTGAINEIKKHVVN